MVITAIVNFTVRFLIRLVSIPQDHMLRQLTNNQLESPGQPSTRRLKPEIEKHNLFSTSWVFIISFSMTLGHLKIAGSGVSPGWQDDGSDRI